MVHNVRPVSGGEMKGLKLLVLNTENFGSTFGFAFNELLNAMSFSNIYRLLRLVSPDWANTMVER